MDYDLIFKGQRLRAVKYLLQFLFVYTLLPVVNSQNQSSEYQVEAYRTYESIEIDGDLSEPEWQKAKPVNHFVQIEPYEGTPISQPMEA